MSSDNNAWSFIFDWVAENKISENAKVLVPWPSFNRPLLEVLNSIPKNNISLLHSFKSQVSLFEKEGFRCYYEWPLEKFDYVLTVPTRQKLESLGHIAKCIQSLKADGTFLLACSNDLGASSFVSYLKEILPDLDVQSKHKAKLCTFPRSALKDESQLSAWIDNGKAQTIEKSSYMGVPGIFGWNKIDQGSTLLLETLPTLSGVGADLGSGYGFLTGEVLKKYSEVTLIDMFEAEWRAIECSKINLKEQQSKVRFHWADLSDDNLRNFEKSKDFVLCNPPFHDGAEVDQDLGKAFVQRAATILKQGGTLYLVANQFLAYEKELAKLFRSVKKIEVKNGFKVIHAIR